MIRPTDKETADNIEARDWEWVIQELKRSRNSERALADALYSTAVVRENYVCFCSPQYLPQHSIECRTAVSALKSFGYTTESLNIPVLYTDICRKINLLLGRSGSSSMLPFSASRAIAIDNGLHSYDDIASFVGDLENKVAENTDSYEWRVSIRYLTARLMFEVDRLQKETNRLTTNMIEDPQDQE